MAAASDIRAGRAFVELTTRDGALIKGLNRAQRKIQDFADSARRVGLVLTGIGAAAATAFVPAIRAASDAEAITRRFTSVFGAQADNATRFVDDFAAAIKRSRLDIQESITSFQAFFVGLGFGASKSLELSTATQKLVSDFSAFNNLSDGEAQGRFISAISGSAEVLDQFGINIREAQIEQELLRQGIRKTAQQATEQEKVVARLAIITRALTDQGAVGAAVTTADQFSSRLRQLRSALRGTSVEIGNKLLPVVTPLVERSTALLKLAGDFVAENGRLVGSLFKLAGGIGVVGASLLGLSGAATGASLALSLIAKNPFAIALVAATVAIAGVTAEMNDGRIAGFEYSEQLRQIAVDLGLLSDAADRFTDANDAAEAAGRALNRALESREAAKTIDERIEATKRLTQAIRDQIAARREVIRQDLRAQGFEPTEQILSLRLNQDPIARGFRESLQREARNFRELLKQAQLDALQESNLLRGELAAATNSSAERRLSTRQQLIASYERELELQRRVVDEFGAENLTADPNRRIAYLQQQITRLKLQQLPDQLRAGFSAGLTVVQKIGELVNDFVRKIQRLDQNIRAFGATGVEADVIAIEQRRDALLDSAREANALTPEREAQIREAAERQIAEARARGDKELQQEIARLEIQATREGLQQRLALLQLERQQALENADETGESVDLINKKFDLLEEIAAQEVDGGLRALGSFSAAAIRALGTPQVSNEEKRTAKATEDTARHTERVANAVENGIYNVG